MSKDQQSKKWMKAERYLDESREWMNESDNHFMLANILMRASMTYDDEDKDGQHHLVSIGKALGLLHPVAVFGACSTMVDEGAKTIVHRFFDDEEYDGDDKVATCKAIHYSTNAVCELISHTNYWNAKEVVSCLQQTANMLDEQRLKDELEGNDDITGVQFAYSFEKGSMRVVESVVREDGGECE